jgi:hypothetical protein
MPVEPLPGEKYVLEGGEYDGAEGELRAGESELSLMRYDATRVLYRRTRFERDGRRVYRVWMPMLDELDPPATPAELDAAKRDVLLEAAATLEQFDRMLEERSTPAAKPEPPAEAKVESWRDRPPLLGPDPRGFSR